MTAPISKRLQLVLLFALTAIGAAATAVHFVVSVVALPLATVLERPGPRELLLAFVLTAATALVCSMFLLGFPRLQWRTQLLLVSFSGLVCVGLFALGMGLFMLILAAPTLYWAWILKTSAR